MGPSFAFYICVRYEDSPETNVGSVLAFGIAMLVIAFSTSTSANIDRKDVRFNFHGCRMLQACGLVTQAWDDFSQACSVCKYQRWEAVQRDVQYLTSVEKGISAKT